MAEELKRAADSIAAAPTPTEKSRSHRNASYKLWELGQRMAQLAAPPRDEVEEEGEEEEDEA